MIIKFYKAFLPYFKKIRSSFKKKDINFFRRLRQDMRKFMLSNNINDIVYSSVSRQFTVFARINKFLWKTTNISNCNVTINEGTFSFGSSTFCNYQDGCDHMTYEIGNKSEHKIISVYGLEPKLMSHSSYNNGGRIY